MFKFVNRFKYFAIVPLVIILLGAIFLGIGGGFVQDVDFAGGMTMYVEMGKDVDHGEITDVVKNVDARITNPKVLSSDGTVIIIQTPPIDNDPEREVRQKIIDALKEKYQLNDEAILQV